MSIWSFCGWENGVSARYCEYCSTVLSSLAPGATVPKSTISDEGPQIAPETTTPTPRLQQVSKVETLDNRETLTYEEIKASLPELVTPQAKMRAPRALGA